MPLTRLLGEEKFKALFDFATEGIIVVDKEGIIILANPAAAKLFDYEISELLQKKIDTLIPARFRVNHDHYRQGYNEAPKARNMGQSMNLFAVKKSGEEFPVEISLSPFENKNEKFVIAFIIDITIRKQNEDAINKQKHELELLANELEKRVKDRTLILEEALHQLEISREELKVALEKEKELHEMKSRFVSMASHEFRTPLATILSSLSLITKYRAQDDKENEFKHIQRVKSSVSHLTDILNDLLSISKLEEGKVTIVPERFDISEFIHHVIAELQTVAKKGQKIIYQHNGGNEVYLDKKILRTIISNLITNAIKFSNEYMSIEINTQVYNDQIILSVRDHGIGISEEDKQHLFERFFRGQNTSNIQGTGLGLNIIAKYLEVLQGGINFESKVDEGTIFLVQLPNNISL